MPLANYEPLGEELRGILQNLTDALFPLDAWIKTKKYVPSQPGLPWRQPGASLSTADLKAVEFFAGLLLESSSDAELSARWNAHSVDPLKACPFPDPQGWRARRGLDAEPAFGVTRSDHVVTDPTGAATSRIAFYDAALPLLVQAVAAARAQGAIDWGILASKLLADTSEFWPQGQPLKSSTFIKQFAKDMLYALLGMRNPVDDPEQRAVLIELGEFRHPGNSYTRLDAQRAVERFRTFLADYAAEHPAPAAPPAPHA